MLQSMWYPSSLCCLLLLVPLLLCSSVSVPTNPYYVECSKPEVLQCGKLNIPYPFRLLKSPNYCGYPGYELNCNLDDEVTPLTIKLGGDDYAVLNFFYLERVIVVVDSYLLNTDCPLRFTNTSFNSTLFSYAKYDSNLTVYVNCSLTTVPPQLSEITCLSNLHSKSYYKVDKGPFTILDKFQGSCELTAAIAVYNNEDFDATLKGGFGLNWKDSLDWCQECTDSGGRCGYNETRPEDQICFCSDTNRLRSCLYSIKKRNKGIVIGIIAALVCILIICGSLCFYTIRRNKLKNKMARTIEDFLDACDYLGPKRYKYSELKKITKSFSEKLGQGGYGTVFKGKFPDGRLVAVKVLSDTKGNGDEFINEVASIGRTSHVNVVSLLGFSSEGCKRTLIYEFMSNGSLEKYIHSENLKFTLGWEKLFQIAVGIARGLEYLHRGCKTRIVHFDIKPHNILLDQDFCPKISDFGLAQLCLRQDSIFSAIETRGTIGYIAPEVFFRNFGVVSSKSDVYSYGMMILEMVGVRNTSHSCDKNDSEYYFPHWIYEHYHQIGHMDCFSVTVELEDIVKKMILVGLWCIQTNPGSRPSMSKVVDMLQCSIDDLEMPPNPTLSSPN